MKVKIVASYHETTTAEIELPDSMVWDDISSWYIEWNKLYYQLKNGAGMVHEIELKTARGNINDWKRPAEVTVFEDGEEVDQQ